MGTSQAQAPALGDVAGKWEGVHPTSSLPVELNIEPTGAFVISSHRVSDRGVAKVEGDRIVMAFTINAGDLNVSRSGEKLQGTMTWGASPMPITFNRKK